MSRAQWFPLAAVLVLLIGQSAGFSGDWPRFRGPNGIGSAGDAKLPVRWSADEGIEWKTPLPGAGSSSPIVVQGKVFVTGYSGYGLDRENPGDIEKLERWVAAVELETGKILWTKTLTTKHRDPAYRGIGIPNHGYASSTPVSDGERVYAFFGVAGVVAFDLEGKELWRADVSETPGTHDFGSGSSPIIVGENLIVPASVETEAIISFDRKTGKERWRAEAAGYGGWWSTPITVESEGGRTDVVVTVPDEIWALNPENGKLRWHADSPSGGSMCTSPVVHDGVIYGVGGRSGGAFAIKAGGKGDVSATHFSWKGASGSYIPSGALVNGHFFWANDRGIAFCVEAASGREVYRERIPDAGSIYSSVLASKDHLYLVTRRNGTIVLAAKPSFEVVARNVIASDTSDFNSSPAVVGNRLLVRSDKALYAISDKASK
jgi:outer membrane protein assembly factor BamB